MGDLSWLDDFIPTLDGMRAKEARDEITTKGWVTIHGHPVLIGGSGSGSGGGHASSSGGSGGGAKDGPLTKPVPPHIEAAHKIITDFHNQKTTLDQVHQRLGRIGGHSKTELIEGARQYDPSLLTHSNAQHIDKILHSEKLAPIAKTTLYNDAMFQAQSLRAGAAEPSAVANLLRQIQAAVKAPSITTAQRAAYQTLYTHLASQKKEST